MCSTQSLDQTAAMFGTATVVNNQSTGDAYIHGIMHEEAWDERKLETIILI